jgi:hypothetical protein
MAGFPQAGKDTEIGHKPENLPVPLPCLRASFRNKGPGRNKFCGENSSLPGGSEDLTNTTTQRACRTIQPKEKIATGRPYLTLGCLAAPIHRESPGAARVTIVLKLVLLFASLLAIPLARQSRLYAFLLAGLQVVGVTLDFLDDVLLLYLPLEPAQRIFQRLAFLNANLCQKIPPPNLPKGLL